MCPMTVDAEAAAIVKSAMKTPAIKRTRLCQYVGAFCASCPDVERLPCVLAGGYWDCETCTEPDCPCMVGWTIERRKVYREWKAGYDRRNGTIDRRKAAKRLENYKSGRKCSVCGAPITDRGKTGKCQSCARRARKPRVT